MTTPNIDQLSPRGTRTLDVYGEAGAERIVRDATEVFDGGLPEPAAAKPDLRTWWEEHAGIIVDPESIETLVEWGYYVPTEEGGEDVSPDPTTRDLFDWWRERHAPGEHDQSSHGNWADGKQISGAAEWIESEINSNAVLTDPIIYPPDERETTPGRGHFYDSAEERAQALSDLVLNGEHTDVESTAGAQGNTIVTFKDGSKAMFRPNRGAQYAPLAGNEYAAWRLSRLIGVDDYMPAVVRGKFRGQQGTWQEFSPVMGEHIAVRTPFIEKIDKLGGVPSSVDGAYAGAVFDFILGNEDRHMGNLSTIPYSDGEGHYAGLIDHTMTFATSPRAISGGGFVRTFMDAGPAREAGDWDWDTIVDRLESDAAAKIMDDAFKLGGLGGIEDMGQNGVIWRAKYLAANDGVFGPMDEWPVPTARVGEWANVDGLTPPPRLRS